MYNEANEVAWRLSPDVDACRLIVVTLIRGVAVADESSTMLPACILEHQLHAQKGETLLKRCSCTVNTVQLPTKDEDDWVAEP